MCVCVCVCVCACVCVGGVGVGVCVGQYHFLFDSTHQEGDGMDILSKNVQKVTFCLAGTNIISTFIH